MNHKEHYIPKTLFITLFAFIVAVISPTDNVAAQRGSGGQATPRPTRPPRVTATPTPSPTPGPVTGLEDGQVDIDDDGDVDIYDYNYLVGSYGWTGPAAGNPADFDDDGDVDEFDFQILAVSYGVVAPQWATDESAIAVCLPNGTVGINVTFQNTETLQDRSMDVLATDTQTGSSLDMGIVPPQSEATGTIQTGVTSLDAGVVLFDLAWINGDPRTDQRFANYNAIECVPSTSTPTPTAPFTPTPTDTPQACAVDYRAIGFTNLNGTTSVEGDFVNSQYAGVSFSLENCSIDSPRISRSGDPLTSFASGDNEPDQPASGETFGPGWITDSGYFGADEPICTLVIDYEADYQSGAVHLDLLDIDGKTTLAGDFVTVEFEEFEVTAYDANQNVVATQFVGGYDDSSDGRATRVNLLSSGDDIAQVRIEGASNKGIVGGVSDEE